MVNKVLYSALFYSSIISAAPHVANPASTAYVDEKVTQLKVLLQQMGGQIALRGIPAGGLAGQTLAKTSNANYATNWQYTIGQHALGGVIFLVYVDANGTQHGLVAADEDEPEPNGAYNWTDATAQCTAKSIVQNGVPYTNWILPSQAQMSALYSSRYLINPTSSNGGFMSFETTDPGFEAYWSSTSTGNPNRYWAQSFGLGVQAFFQDNSTFHVRCIRTF